MSTIAERRVIAGVLPVPDGSINTRAERRQIAGVFFVLLAAVTAGQRRVIANVLPVPDGAINTLSERKHAAGVYFLSDDDTVGNDNFVIIDRNNVVQGVVLHGVRPASTDTTYYRALRPDEDVPEVGWFFSQTCQTYSEALPEIAPGDIAPPGPFPGTPGGHPNPGDANYPSGPSNPGLTPLAFTIPVPFALHADGVDTVPIASVLDSLTEIDELLRVPMDCTFVCAYQPHHKVVTASGRGEVVHRYSTDGGATWANLSAGGNGPICPLTIVGNQIGLAVNIAEEAKQLILISPFTRSGDNSPAVLGEIGAILYQKVDAGSCIEISEDVETGGVIRFGFTLSGTGEVSDDGDGGGGDDFEIPDVTPGFGTPIVQDDFSSYTSTSDMRARLLAGTDAAGIDAGSIWAGKAHTLIVDTVDGQQALRSADFTNDSDNYKTLGAPITDLWLRQVRWREAFAAAAADIVAQGPWAMDTTVLTAAWYFYVTTEYLAGHVRHQCGVGGGGSLVETANTHTDEADATAFNALAVWDQIMHLVDTGSAIECTYFFNGVEVAFMRHSYTTDTPAGFNRLLVRPVSVNGEDVTSLLLWEAFDGGDPYGLA